MYSFAQRPDTTVLDEPFYACYLHKSGADHPGKDEVLRAQPVGEDDAIASVFRNMETPVVFIKNMAHHIAWMRDDYLTDLTNIFLIRNPSQIIASYAEVIQSPVMRDIGIADQYHLFEKLRAAGQEPVVIDSGEVLRQPEALLRLLCGRVGLPFVSDMLHWKAGPKPYDGVWATHWYHNVHQSTGFEKQPTSNRPLPPHLMDLYVEAVGYYEKLLAFSLKA